MRIILKPFAEAYRAFMSLRQKLYQDGKFESFEPKLPVLSIGNISAGGTGKTPLCIFLALKLKERFKPVILSRGYGGTYDGIYRLKPGDDPRCSGDEPLLILEKTGCPVVLSRNRAKGARFIEENSLGDLIILDDGLQHLRLLRRVNLICLDISDQRNVEDIIKNRTLPWGRLREDRDQALRRANCLVLSNRMPKAAAVPPPRELLKLIPRELPIFTSYFEGRELISLKDSSPWRGAKEVSAFCAIANPAGFIKTLESMGYKIRQALTKKDHAAFGVAELRELRAQNPGLPMVCTEKDAVKIPREEAEGIYKLKGELSVQEEDKFIGYIVELLAA